MGLTLRRRTPEERSQTPIERRASRIATPDLYGWTEQALTALGRSLRDYQRSGTEDALAEAELGAEALLAVIRELKRRTVAL